MYPEIEPYDAGLLDVGDGQAIYWETCGNPDGKPVVFLHGGPGGGSSADHRRLFDPARYRIVLFDQRGCGRSTPHASAAEYDLAYAETHPDRVRELVLRGIFTLRRAELDWFYEGGAAAVFPDLWEQFLAPVPVEQRGHLIRAYSTLLHDPDPAVHATAAIAWSRWESSTITLLPRPDVIARFTEPSYALAFARIENHYFVHGGWWEDGQLIRDAGRLADIPTVIVQGRYDMCTPPMTAWALAEAMPHAQLRMIPDAGHAFDEPGILDALLEETDRFAA
jgi:proline iminopeptidase